MKQQELNRLRHNEEFYLNEVNYNYIKTCSKCGQDKELKMYNKDRQQSDGFKNHCKQCESEHKKRVRQYKETTLIKVKSKSDNYKKEVKEISKGKSNNKSSSNIKRYKRKRKSKIYYKLRRFYFKAEYKATSFIIDCGIITFLIFYIYILLNILFK